MEGLLERIGRATARHVWWTISCWLLAAIALLAIGQAAGGTFVNEFRIPGANSQRAIDQAQAHFPGVGATSADVVWHARGGTLRDPGKAAAIARMVERIQHQPDVVSAPDPLQQGGEVTRDGRTAISNVQYGKDLGELSADAAKRLQAAAQPVRAAGVEVEFRGLVIELANPASTSWAEAAGLAAALVVLLFAFGSVIAAGLPIAMAMVGLVVGSALMLLSAAVFDFPTAATAIAVMLGLGAGIDYALLVVNRFRMGLTAGSSTEEAVGRAMATAGHAVLLSGGATVVAILGLLFVGIPFIGMIGVAAALIVAVMVLAALTLLPAILGLVGHRISSLRIGRPQPLEPAARFWNRWGRSVSRRPVLNAAVATVLLALIATPVLGLRLGMPDDGNMPTDWTQRRAYDIVAQEFGRGWNAPLLVVVPLKGDGRVGGELAPLASRLAADPEVRFASPPATSRDRRVAMLTVVPQHAPQDEKVGALVHRIRDRIGPATVGRGGGEALVGGPTAYMIDLADSVAARLPWVVAAVILAAALLLTAMFRAPVLAAKVAVMSLLSIGAAYGVLVAVFQWGWGLALLGVDKPVPIMSAVPMLLFAILFGLSMDYEVFLLSAIREDYRAHGDAHRAVVAGLSATGRVITSAALIMAVVFLSFVWIDDTLVKMIGVGLAAAVIVDATIVRMALAPAVIHLLGDRAWWWPGRRSRQRREPEELAQSSL